MKTEIYTPFACGAFTKLYSKDSVEESFAPVSYKHLDVYKRQVTEDSFKKEKSVYSSGR